MTLPFGEKIMEHLNAVTNNVFSAANQDHLTQHAQLLGLTSNQWAGFQQWKRLGRRVASGGKGCKIYMACQKNVESNVTSPVPTDKQPTKRNVIKGLYVFNIEHTVEIEEE